MLNRHCKPFFQFLWDENISNLTWEQKLAKKYYEKLFREYCICDLSRYKENKVSKNFVELFTLQF